MVEGLSYEEAVAETEERKRINDKAEQIIGTPIEKWPEFSMNWDTSPEGFHYSFDGAPAGSINTADRVVMWVRLDELDAVLQSYNLRTKDEIWDVGNHRRAAKVIVHCSEGGKLSPIAVVPTTPGKVGLSGGNHRLAIARAKGVEAVPLLIEKKHAETVTKLICSIIPTA